MAQTGYMSTYEGEKIEYEILEDGKRYKKMIRKIRYKDDGEIGFIFGYYYWDINNEFWRWGQRPLVTSQDEMKELFQKAKNQGFF